MEQQEERREKVYVPEKRRRQSKSTLSFPLDLTSEILLRLPEKSVARFGCVSKLWLSITTDPYFINSFEARLPKPTVLLCFKEGNKLFVSSIPQHDHLFKEESSSYSSSQPIYRYHMEFPKISNVPPTESVKGLICFQESAAPIVWNPSKRQFLTLPKPRLSWNDRIKVFLGYDPIEHKHKVMCMPLNRTCDVCRILTLGSDQETWRTVKTNHMHRSSWDTYGRCINGVIYYQAYIYHTRVWVLMSFDVRSETFRKLNLPAAISRDKLLNYKGRLACVGDKGRFIEKNTLWILEDAEKQRWSYKNFDVPFGHFDDSLRTSSELKGFTQAGDLIYAPYTFGKSHYILFCDPVTIRYRRFSLGGIADDEARPIPLNHYYSTPTLHTFPNHI
ncbi:unnamed protein product [Microthlaspi erraticum]|uniref:F-box domain-containing protein n=1 Tax=Microthlaspi erraticum TaxID=1685480 RepID=A0A6D2KQC1_9BRAS|nr:unnamed protein product [Microthlaspi erraticum]